MLEAIYDKWQSKVVTGEEPVQKPGMLCFSNCAPALEMLHQYVASNGNIAVHCDVDMDGIGTGYILKRFLSELTYKNQLYVINSTKTHGVEAKHPKYFNDTGIDLMIIVDSSSNELDVIKQFNCDVLVIDHHEINHNSTMGYTNDGHRYIIVNNMVSNPDVSSLLELASRVSCNVSSELSQITSYEANENMSCGLVIYELLRVYSDVYSTGNILENTMLYQWVGVTLFTDAVQLLNDRNQWYIDNTVHSLNTEVTLYNLIHTLSKFNTSLTKSIINYSLAPAINRAIRGGASVQALTVVLVHPELINELAVYRDMQDWAIARGIEEIVEYPSFVLRDITDTQINSNYSGVIAGRLCGDFKKNAVVYSVKDGIASGSFRGRVPGADYIGCFTRFADGIYAQGHKPAFGFRVPLQDLPKIMETLKDVEEHIETREYLTAGNMPAEFKGVYHIDDIDAFKKAGGIMMLGIGNSKVSSAEQIVIALPSNCAIEVERRGKLIMYDTLGLLCKAFTEVQPGIIKVYAEYAKSIECFIK